MDHLMRFFTAIGQNFITEAQRLDASGDRAGALEAYHRSERASALGLEAAAKVAPYIHARIAEAHDQAPAEVMIKGGLRDASVPADELPVERLAPEQKVAPPPPQSELPLLEAIPIEPGTADKPGPKRWKVDI
jgi:hypothetical protein